VEHDGRYVSAQEHLEVAFALWNSVEPDAVVLNREKGLFVDPAKVHRLDFRGEFFNVRGPLPALPSPQQRPVIIQAARPARAWTLPRHTPTCSSARGAPCPA
jgi:alkanesulfonate monooxygenase SsuD/methylene tetrahydromethanopterin reductase-like flavin-dependent oxidoreductase (luciferase family)